jgi:hypothetical protein
MSGPTRTRIQRLATLLLDEDVITWLTARREQGASWYKLADDLRDATDGEVALSHEAVRNWLDAVPTGPKAAS